MPKQGIQQKIIAKARITPLLQQSIQLLALPYDDLISQINQSLEENIVLVEAEPAPTQHAYAETAQETQISHTDSLSESLYTQISQHSFNTKQRNIAQIILENLTEKGFLEVSLEAVQRIYNRHFPSDNAQIEECAYIRTYIQQQLEPFGIASFSTQEFLGLQLMEQPSHPDHALHMALLANEMEIADLSTTQRAEFVARIQHLARSPDIQQPNRYMIETIQPDLSIKDTDDGWQIHVTRLPKLALNQSYLSVHKNMEDKHLLHTHIQQARSLMSAIHYRSTKLIMLAELLIHTQAKALTQGLQFLTPLSQKELAEMLQIHPSTLSRLIQNKYMHTPIGTIKMQDLCSASIDTHASTAIKLKIKAMIEAETEVLSDEKICQRLSEEEHIAIARRTVAKFRATLNIPSSRARRKRKQLKLQ